MVVLLCCGLVVLKVKLSGSIFRLLVMLLELVLLGYMSFFFVIMIVLLIGIKGIILLLWINLMFVGCEVKMILVGLGVVCVV